MDETKKMMRFRRELGDSIRALKDAAIFLLNEEYVKTSKAYNNEEPGTPLKKLLLDKLNNINELIRRLEKTKY